MEPNAQPDAQSPHPIDYLDEISTVPKGAGKGVNDKLFFGILIGGLLIALIVGAFAFMSSGSNSKDNFATLSVRLTNLQEIVDASQKNLVSSELRAVNTSTSLVLANANRDIVDPLATYGIEPKKINPKVTAEENIDELNERLEDARLNAAFDRTYAVQMSYQLKTTLILLEETESKTKNKDQKEFLTATHDNLAPLQELFAEFDAASS